MGKPEIIQIIENINDTVNLHTSNTSKHKYLDSTKTQHATGNSEGYETEASGEYSHAQNDGTIANGASQTAIGKYNVSDTTSALIVGNGTADNARSNALTVDFDGNVNIREGADFKINGVGLKSLIDGAPSMLSATASATLLASSWTGSDAPYSYVYSNVNIFSADTPIELLPGGGITAEQLDALQAANIVGGTQLVGSVTLLAYGEKPTIDVPAQFIFRRDI